MSASSPKVGDVDSGFQVALAKYIHAPADAFNTLPTRAREAIAHSTDIDGDKTYINCGQIPAAGANSLAARRHRFGAAGGWGCG